jgi:hypothetical protein
MAFVVEDGTGKSDANSYISVADADSYWSDRGEPTEWGAADDTTKQQALVKATSYIDAHYHWLTGSILSTTQALAWPRINASDRHGRAYDSDVVPAAVEDAACELAQKVLEGDDLAPDVESRVSKEKVGPIEVEYAGGGSSGTTSYSYVDQLLSGLVSSSVEAVVIRS